MTRMPAKVRFSLLDVLANYTVTLFKLVISVINNSPSLKIFKPLINGFY